MTAVFHPSGRILARIDAFAMNSRSVIVKPYASQLFQPIGGAAARGFSGIWRAVATAEAMSASSQIKNQNARFIGITQLRQGLR